MRILAISDIHGCIVALANLLAYVRLQPDDWIITLGDYVDRGPASAGVLDRLIKLHQSHNVISLRGNHDQVMLQHFDNQNDELEFWLAIGGRATLESYDNKIENIPDAHWDFLKNTCRDWYETDSHIFVHAYAAPHLPMEQQHEQELFWSKLDQWAPRHQSGKTIICAHTVQKNRLPLNLGYAICIETGVYTNEGWLTCLDIVSGQFWQSNERGETRHGIL